VQLLETLGPEAIAAFEAQRTTAATAESKKRAFVRLWTMDDIDPHVARVYAYRNFKRGEALFEGLECAECHRFGERGNAYGPDLTAVGGRFAPRDLLLTMLEPTRDLSDQYAAIALTLENGDSIVGMLVQEDDDVVVIAPDPRMSAANIVIKKETIRKRVPTTVMPPGLLGTCTMDEILDLLAYLATGGDETDPAFKRPP
jgi:putative heme-binding domain-containing protein